MLKLLQVLWKKSLQKAGVHFLLRSKIKVKKVCFEFIPLKALQQYFNWYTVKLFILISARVMRVLVNQNVGKFKENFKF